MNCGHRRRKVWWSVKILLSSYQIRIFSYQATGGVMREVDRNSRAFKQLAIPSVRLSVCLPVTVHQTMLQSVIFSPITARVINCNYCDLLH